MARRKFNSSEAALVSARLKAFVLNELGSWEKLLALSGVPRTTAATWRRKKAPAVPDAALLLQLVRTVNIDVNWLLTGRGGGGLWVERDPKPDQQCELLIKAKLRATEGATEKEFQMVWERLGAGAADSKGPAAALVLAVDGVRSRFREELKLVRSNFQVFNIAVNGLPSGVSLLTAFDYYRQNNWKLPMLGAGTGNLLGGPKRAKRRVGRAKKTRR